jgi:alcohol dehydrogenase
MNEPAAPSPNGTLAPFDAIPSTRLIFGLGSVSRVGELARELGGRKILLVTDPGIVAAGHAGLVATSLEAAGLPVVVFDRARENPTTSCVEDCSAFAKQAGINLIIGLGGGSSMDTAKGCNFLLTNGGRMQDYWGVGKATQPMLPLIAIPTTAGTGSECQSAALIVDEQTHQKMACLDKKAAARIAILDPALTVSQPASVTAATGMDALAHALETAVTNRRTPLSAMYSREAFHYCAASFPEVLRKPANTEARGKMLLGAALAGMAIENSMLGAAHAAANPLTAHYDMVHGQAVAVMLPHVVLFNAALPEVAHLYRELVAGSPALNHQPVVGDSAQELARMLHDMQNLALIPNSLVAHGVARSALPKLAREAAAQWTATFNPRRMGEADFLRLYEAAFEAPGQPG